MTLAIMCAVWRLYPERACLAGDSSHWRSVLLLGWFWKGLPVRRAVVLNFFVVEGLNRIVGPCLVLFVPPRAARVPFRGQQAVTSGPEPADKN